MSKQIKTGTKAAEIAQAGQIGQPLGQGEDDENGKQVKGHGSGVR
jgi:hypothetical protein